MSRRLVVSAVNFSEGGPLTVLRECLAAAVETLPGWEVIALVHRADLVGVPAVRYLEFPDSKRSWFRRMYYEYYRFRGLSRELRPDVWLSLHDMSPFVAAGRQAVYCHNPMPFFRPRLGEAISSPGLLAWVYLYRVLYRINIRSNAWVIVQQQWIRREFERMFGLRNVVVAYPQAEGAARATPRESSGSVVFLYPALPRPFKNIEVLCEAARILWEEGRRGFEVRLTMSGTENRYARRLRDRYAGLPPIRLLGRLDRERMRHEYAACSAVVFPSRLETWGLPITEAKVFGKPLVVADLPYGHEATGCYEDATFFPPEDAGRLAEILRGHLDGTATARPHVTEPPPAPFAPDWPSLLQLLVSDVAPG